MTGRDRRVGILSSPTPFTPALIPASCRIFVGVKDVNNTVAVLGGGAAGFFGAIACAEANPQLTVYLIEKTGKLLSKVRISGGGRCNVTHAADTPAQLVLHYPRGAKQLK